MHDNDVLSVPRLWTAMRADIYQHWRGFAIAASAAAAVLMLVSVASGQSGARWDFHAIFFPLSLMIGGYLFTASSYADSHRGPRAHNYLTLPISNLERLIGRLLLSTVCFVVVSLASYWLTAAVSAVVSQLIWGASHGVFVPTAWMWRSILLYLVTSSVFLFGAAYFRRFYALKVVISLALLGLALAALATGLSWLLFGGAFQDGASLSFDIMVEAPRMARVIATSAKVFLWGLMAPLFWVMAYLRIRELEV